MAIKKTTPNNPYTPNTTEDIIKQISKVSTVFNDTVFNDKDDFDDFVIARIKLSLESRKLNILEMSKEQLQDIAILSLKLQVSMAESLQQLHWRDEFNKLANKKSITLP